MWSDEFSGTSPSSDWTLLRGHRGGTYAWPYNPDLDDSAFAEDQTQVEDGNLVVKWTKRNTPVGDRIFPYSAGVATTADSRSFHFGIIEARVWIPDAPGTWPAMWMLPATPQETWPPEVDIAEWNNRGSGTDALFNLHWGTESAHQQLPRQIRYGTNLGGQWHTYRLEWRKDRMVLSLDGEQVYENLGRAVPDQPMYLLFSAGVERDAKPEDGAMKVDYVRVWQ